MNDPRTAPEIRSPRPRRALRREVALVAQYIHDLSDRHADARRARSAAAERPRASVPVHRTEPQGG